MKTFIVGDIQGCYKGLTKVLKKAKFDANTDKLYAVGDLIARGPDSLDTIKYLKDLGDAFDTVLGNHDLHLIAIAHGIRNDKAQDKLGKLIQHKSFNKIIDWLMSKPLALKAQKKTLITHAGLHPSFSVKQALQLSDEVSEQLQSKNATKFLKNMYGNSPNVWTAKLKSTERWRFVINAMTRMRYLESNNALEFATKCHPNFSPSHLCPWFEVENPHLDENHSIIFGHWAALNGLHIRQSGTRAKLFGLDTGFVWGNALTLLELPSEKIIQVNA